MKFFPESIVPDPDKKFHINDKDIINKLIDGLLKKDKELRLLKQEQYNWFNGHYGEGINGNLEKKENKIQIICRKISIYNKKNFDDDLDLFNSHWDCVNDYQQSTKPMTNENLGTKKLCGINISSFELKFSTAFAVGSNDTVYNDPPKDNKLYKCAYDNLESYIDYILKKINSNG
jgi:hypothetical protein